MRSSWIPPALLTAVALAQIVLAKTGDLTAWKGGGFGMFSSLDQSANRGVRVVVDAPDRSEAIEIPPSLEVEAARAAAYPADWLLKDLAEGVVARERRYGRPVTRVTITAWRTDFDRVTLGASERGTRTFTYQVPDGRE